MHAQYLSGTDCPLVRLLLHSADVDDFECKNFVEAIKSNNNLRLGISFELLEYLSFICAVLLCCV